jgi:hypothetical protein
MRPTISPAVEPTVPRSRWPLIPAAVFITYGAVLSSTAPLALVVTSLSAMLNPTVGQLPPAKLVMGYSFLTASGILWIIGGVSFSKRRWLRVGLWLALALGLGLIGARQVFRVPGS